MAEENNNTVQYTDDNIRHLSDMEHVRTRPGMYIGRLGDGNLPEDGIYVLLKEVVDNSIDEFKMGAGARLEIDIEDNRLWPRHSAGQACRGCQRAQYWWQVRQQGLQEECGPEWCGCEGGQCPQLSFRGEVFPRGKGAPSCLRTGHSEERQDLKDRG